MRLSLSVLLASVIAACVWSVDAANADDSANAALGRTVVHELAADVGQVRASKRVAKSSDRDGWRPPTLRGASPRKVFGWDDRELVADTTVWPWTTTCWVEAEFANGVVAGGTAVMIGERHALTAAHVIHSNEDGGWADSVTVVPGYAFGRDPFGTAYAKRMFTFGGWIEFDLDEFDMALIELDRPIGNDTGWLGLWVADAEELKGAMLHSAGYPGDRYSGEAMMRTSGLCRSVTESFLKYRGTFDMWSGQSGSGLWVERDGSRYVVGVNTWDTRKTNAGTRLTSAKFASIDAWLDGYSSPAALRPVTCLPDFTTVDGQVQPGQSGTVTVRIANDGAAPAATTIRLSLVSPYGVEQLMAEQPISVAGESTAAAVIAVQLPSEIETGVNAIRATVNATRAVREKDYTDNALDSAGVVIDGPWLRVTPNRGMSDFISAGAQMRYVFEVPDAAKKLTLQFGGHRWSTGYIEAPDGTRYDVERTRGRWKFREPMAGDWRVLVTASRYANFSRHRVKAKLRVRK